MRITGIEAVASSVAIVHLDGASEPASVAVVREDDGINYIQFYPDVFTGRVVDMRSLIERINLALSMKPVDEVSEETRAMQLVKERATDPVTYLHGDDGRIFAAVVSLELLERIEGVEDEAHGHIDPS